MVFSPFGGLLFLFLFGEKKKEPKKKSARGIMGQGTKFCLFLSSFRFFFFQEKEHRLPITTVKKDLALLDEACACVLKRLTIQLRATQRGG